MNIMQILRRKKNQAKQTNTTNISEASSTNTPPLTSARLAVFNDNHLLFRQQELGIAPEEKPSWTEDIFRAARTLILHGRKGLDEAYATNGPVKMLSGEPYDRYSYKFHCWAKKQGKPALHSEEVAELEKIAAAVFMHPRAAALLKHGEPGRVVQGFYAGADCEARIDWLHPEYGIVAVCVFYGIDYLPHHARNMSRELAFARALLAAETGKEVSVHVVGVERAAPFRCGVCSLSEQAMAKAAAQNAKDIARLLECRRTDTWPTGYEDVIEIDTTY